MIIARRPFAYTGVALLGAGIIAATPALAPVAPAVPHLAVPQIELQASVLEIFTFPGWRQAIANQVEFLAIQATGLANSGAGFAESLATLPATVLTAFQQTFSGDPLGALTTVEDWIIGSAEATFVPLIAANIGIGQIQLAIQSALLVAQPVALVEWAAGVFGAFDTVNRAIITATQNFIAAVRSLNLGNIVQAVIGGVTGVAGSFVAGGQVAVNGIVAAQNTIATALAARPAPVQPTAAVSAGSAVRSAAATLPGLDARDTTDSATTPNPSPRANSARAAHDSEARTESAPKAAAATRGGRSAD